MIIGEWKAKSTPGPAFDSLAEPPPGRRKAVMLIPGLLGGDERLSFLAGWFRHWGYRAIESGIKRNSHCPDRLIESLSTRLRANLAKGEKALLVGHSKGGLLSYGIAHRYPELVERVLALGSPLRDPFDLQWNTAVTVHAVATLNRIRRESLPGCYTRECSCEAMRLVYNASPPPVPVTNIASRKDGIVRFESCLHPHVVIREVNTWHNSMPCEPEVIAVVAAWLAQSTQDPPVLAAATG
ncbi:MAG: alpha/beta hydrolase [Hyphomicrobiales bacterium]